mmetsp:Transcript_21936/g.55806  ORF Transcript_21936/g.55806 Transcript_21936/m.55806 type:complete len:362 (-) Transcript_21936:560-1645(-)
MMVYARPDARRPSSPRRLAATILAICATSMLPSRAPPAHDTSTTSGSSPLGRALIQSTSSSKRPLAGAGAAGLAPARAGMATTPARLASKRMAMLVMLAGSRGAAPSRSGRKDDQGRRTVSHPGRVKKRTPYDTPDSVLTTSRYCCPSPLTRMTRASVLAVRCSPPGRLAARGAPTSAYADLPYSWPEKARWSSSVTSAVAELDAAHLVLVMGSPPSIDPVASPGVPTNVTSHRSWWYTSLKSAISFLVLWLYTLDRPMDALPLGAASADCFFLLRLASLMYSSCSALTMLTTPRSSTRVRSADNVVRAAAQKMILFTPRTASWQLFTSPRSPSTTSTALGRPSISLRALPSRLRTRALTL